MQFRKLLGWSFILIGATFIAWNSLILARGAARWAFSWWEAIAYGSVAATVPWVLAAMPVLIAISWRPGRRIGRPTLATFIGCLVWLMFAAYNLLGAGSAISMVRSDVVTERKHAHATQKGMESRRALLEEQLAGIPKGTRPEGTVAAAIKAQEASVWWTNYTEGCTSIENPKGRRFCAEYQKLVGELAAAKQMTAVASAIAELDQQYALATPAADVVDPEAIWWGAVLGVPDRTVQTWLPLKTPLVLELGAMTLWYFGFLLLGVSHASTVASTNLPAQARVQPAALPHNNVPDLSRQRELAIWFFREAMRPAAEGSLPEDDWYRHYCDVCARSNDIALPLEGFRRIAKNYIPAIKGVEGKTYYLGALPLVPAKVA